MHTYEINSFSPTQHVTTESLAAASPADALACAVKVPDDAACVIIRRYDAAQVREHPAYSVGHADGYDAAHSEHEPQPDLRTVLVYADPRYKGKRGKPVAKGATVTTSTGRKATVVDWQIPHKIDASGRVYVDEGQPGATSRYYASVFGLEFVPPSKARIG